MKIQYGWNHRIMSWAALAAAFLIDHLTSDLVIGSLGLKDGAAKDWLETLYIAPFLALGLWIAAMLNRVESS